jgi:hypothetical protein
MWRGASRTSEVTNTTSQVVLALRPSSTAMGASPADGSSAARPGTGPSLLPPCSAPSAAAVSGARGRLQGCLPRLRSLRKARPCTTGGLSCSVYDADSRVLARGAIPRRSPAQAALTPETREAQRLTRDAASGALEAIQTCYLTCLTCRRALATRHASKAFWSSTVVLPLIRVPNAASRRDQRRIIVAHPYTYLPQRRLALR